MHTQAPSATREVSLENLGCRAFEHLFILLGDCIELDTYQNPFHTNFPPVFVDHARSVPINREGYRPAIRPGHYCWVIRRDGLRNKLVRLLVGQGLVGDEFHTAYAVYESSQDYMTLTRAGILVVPTRNVFGAGGLPSEALAFKREGYQEWEETLVDEAHYDVQLLFQDGYNSTRDVAEWIPGMSRFDQQLDSMEGREREKRRDESMVEGEWRDYVA